MAALQPVRGTHDLMPGEFRAHLHVAETARAVAERYGYHAMSTPIFEFTEVFQRTLGETSDVVSKEMYTFTDRSGDSITLRPENTAGVCRALISAGMAQDLPCKFFYYGPMFRHERPQKGRLRQFHQIGVELLGVDKPLGDVEVIACGAAILDALGIGDRVSLEINSLGDADSRRAYREALVAYFTSHLSALSEDSRQRLDRNPLRILDSKDEGDRRVIAGAPAFAAFLTPAAASFRDTVQAGLTALGIRFVVNERLVRGLDYYCHTAFEFTTQMLGAQGTVMGGGRYDGLVAAMGGPPVPGVGWAAGVERLAMLLAEPPRPRRAVAIVPIGTTAEARALELAERLRRSGHACDLGYGGNAQKRMKRANKIGARFALVFGDDELARGAVALRDLDDGTQSEIPLDGIEAHLAAHR
ncbi:MAG: histidine--tRNA ligase [Alphaproteobacteria bacterium]|nr:histidine--tRNA ligase [Alphaproteobacteria bacterium]